ncbi:hypothetical protein KL910_002546 [Ogataea haglerorum]|nr:hypothetical protein KL945_004720 [Ogataea haglerorum]KAG7789840.1 hypothetical protein KL910_002546 [Ogataea haglerorum]
MSLQMMIVFGLLVTEMTLMTILVMPLPHKVQNGFVNLAYKLLQNPNVKVGLVFGASVLGMMFMDALRTAVPKIPEEYRPGMPASGNVPPVPSMIAGATWSEVRARKFYSQRNMYLTAGALFLGIAIYFNIILLKSLVKNKEKLIKTTTVGKGKKAVSTVEYEELKQVLKKKEIDVENLKKQITRLHEAYQNKADESESTSSATAAKKED